MQCESTPVHRATYIPLASVARSDMQPVELDDAAEAELEYADDDCEGEQELDELQGVMDAQRQGAGSSSQPSGFGVERLVSTFHPPGRFQPPASAAAVGGASGPADDAASVASRVSGASGRSGGAR